MTDRTPRRQRATDEELVGSWMTSLGFEAPVVRPLATAVVECADVIIVCPPPWRTRPRDTGRWEWLANERRDVAVLTSLADARAIVARADARGVALFVVEPSGTTRAANDSAVDLEAALVREAAWERARRVPPVVPCPLCGTPFSDDDGYRLHLDAAHGLVDDPGATTVLAPRAVDRVELGPPEALVQTPEPLVLTPQRAYRVRAALAAIGDALARADAATPPDEVGENPHTQVPKAAADAYRRAHRVRWGHG